MWAECISTACSLAQAALGTVRSIVQHLERFIVCTPLSVNIFLTRYKEHIQAIRTNNPNSKYAEHILDTQHTYSNIHETMDILHFEEKRPLMNTLEQFHIYSLWKENLHIYDIYTDIHNPIFNTIINHYK
jgi:hypothetical protein